MARGISTVVVLIGGALCAAAPAAAQAPAPPSSQVDLTLERMVELGLRDSFRVRQLQLEVERTRSLLKAEQAGLKSKVTMNISAPQFQAISDNKWNSTLQRNELVREDTRRYQFDLAIRQPVILFGYPTNGVLSLNNRVYRYTQINEDERDTTFYNRYFVAYSQPLFQPNRMKNNLEQARLGLEQAELKYQSDVVGIIDDLASDYFDLVSDAYKVQAARDFMEDLSGAMGAARAIVAGDRSRSSEADLLQVELANAQESVSQTSNNFRNREETIKQRLQVPPGTSLSVRPDLAVVPVQVEVEDAVQRAVTSTPRVRQLEISTRENEIRLEETRGNNSFRMNLDLTYGREVQDPVFRNLWSEPRNSYTLAVSATVPIWDWGERQHRVQAQQFNLDRSKLSEDRTRSETETDVRNLVATLQDYTQRLATMRETLALARQLTETSLQRYRAGDMTLVEMLQAITRESQTSNNYLNAFMGYQRTLRRLKEVTFYDFEVGQTVVQRFHVESSEGMGKHQ